MRVLRYRDKFSLRAKTLGHCGHANEAAELGDATDNTDEGDSPDSFDRVFMFWGSSYVSCALRKNERHRPDRGEREMDSEKVDRWDGKVEVEIRREGGG